MMKSMAQKTYIFMMTTFCIVLLKSQDCAAFRCGKGLVSTGDAKVKVLTECGKPTYKETGRKKAGTKIAGGTANRHDSGNVEKWYYNCGDNDFIYVLEFENNILQREDTVDRGKGKSDCMGIK